VGLLALAGLATAAAATGTHRRHRVHRTRASTQTVLTTYSGKRGKQLVVVQKGQKLALYDFSKDKMGSNKSTCYGTCSKTWYPLIKHGTISFQGSGIKQSQIKTFRRTDGSIQVEYYGQPLYRCHKNTRSGQIYGTDSYQFGGSWGLMGAQGSALAAPGYGGGKPVPPC
jgi:predicted lipoprotein with Yx(FWY)xxD motif